MSVRPAFMVFALLSGCAAIGLPMTAPEPPAVAMTPVAPVPAITPPKSPPIVAAVVKHFDAAKSRELSVVLGPDVTAEQIDAIRLADRRARLALTRLGRVLPHAKPADLSEALTAVMALETALAKNDQTGAP